jgi:NNP family nitrate/nitrite transporter-like MFS transporter
MATLTDLVDQRHWGKAMSIHQFGPNLSFFFAPLLAELLLILMGWRAIFAIIGLTNTFMGMLYLFFGQGGRFPGEPPNFANLVPIVSKRSFWIITIISCIGSGADLGVYSILPTFLINDRGMGQTQANTLLSSSRIAGFVILFLVGWLIDRFGAKPLLATTGGLVALLTIGIGLTHSTGLMVVVFFQPALIQSLFFTCVYALTKICARNTRNVAFSLMVPFTFLIGAGVVPAIMGLLGEHVSFSIGFIILGGLLGASTLLVRVLKLPQS